MRAKRVGLCACVVAVMLAAAAQAGFVTVGNPGNADDTHGDGYGGVDYEYRMGTYEVTAGEYSDFLNAVAATDTYGLYATGMTDTFGCQITRSGTSGSYGYSVAGDWADRPVNYVSWYDAARYCNWLTNGATAGSDTENGVYDLTGLTTVGTILDHQAAPSMLGVTTAYFIPTEDEWYKAAYHKNDGVTGNYFDYSMSSDTVPSNDLVDPDPGNNGTFYDSGYTIGSLYYRTEVGAHENSGSPYGTFDQGGNVWEWNETLISGSYRGVRGGSFDNYDGFLHADYRDGFGPTVEVNVIGFRVASLSVIPEPGSVVLLIVGLAGVVGRRRRVAR